MLWAAGKPISQWLNRPPRAPRKEISERYQRLLRTSALRTWRYFAEFSTEEHHWLIPDNVVEEGRKVAPRISPTNLGFLFNVRQVACDFGYLTVPELVQLNLRTLATAFEMERYHGHFLNWYDTRTLAPLNPAIISSVDNGNLVASLWTLQQGSRQLLREALLPRELSQGLIDHLYLLTTMGALPRRKFSAIERALRGQMWMLYLLRSWKSLLGNIRLRVSKAEDADEAGWLLAQVEERLERVQGLVQLYAPWLLEEFASLRNDPEIRLQNRAEDLPALERMPSFIDSLSLRLQAAIDSSPSGENGERYQNLLALLPEARGRVVTLIEEIRKLDQQAGRLADEMDFGFLFNRRRNLLSVAFEVEKQELLPACYDLLASEARIAYFIAIGKDEIPQEASFNWDERRWNTREWWDCCHGRDHVRVPDAGAVDAHLPEHVVGTFEDVAVQAQQEYAAGKRCRGEFRNRRAPKSMTPATTSTSRLECPIWRSTNRTMAARSFRHTRR